ncbi:MAG: succinate dehydrogenase assembly factor 2 [Betaproteobacteria bacterium]|nr:succinate dehydrogenase assembly factor 2 [Betaproteobacteria bacterium]
MPRPPIGPSVRRPGAQYCGTPMDEAELRRLQWSCRRGMLENDLALERFLKKHARTLDGERLKAFKALLDYPDSDLRELLSGRREARDSALCDIVQLVRSCESRGSV